MRPPITASLPPSDTGSHAPAPKDDARPNTRAGLDRAQGERPAARQKQVAPLLLEPLSTSDLEAVLVLRSASD
jgi:hypothetical protein